MADTRLTHSAIERRLRELRKQLRGDEGLHAIQALAKSTDLLDELVLLRLLEDRSVDVRWVAVETLEERGGPFARIGAKAALGDPSHSVRSAAAEALGWLGSRRDGSWLLTALADEDWVVRCSAAEGLGYFGGPRARRALLKTLTDDPHPTVRMWASGALGDLEDPTVVPLLEQALETESDHWVSRDLVRTLYRLGHRPLEEYLACLEDEDCMGRLQTLSGMPEEVRPEHRDAVIAALRQHLECEEPPAFVMEETLGRLIEKQNSKAGE
jgi:HEAT repeat protein